MLNCKDLSKTLSMIKFDDYHGSSNIRKADRIKKKGKWGLPIFSLMEAKKLGCLSTEPWKVKVINGYLANTWLILGSDCPHS